MKRTEYLQNLVNQLIKSNQYEFTVEYCGRGGWWMIPDEAREIGDKGDYLGRNWRDAEEQIKLLLS